MVDLHDFLTENLAETLSVLHQVLVFDDLQCSNRHSCCHWVAAECRAVLTRFDVHHDVVVAKHCRHWHHTAAESLTEDKDVRTHAFVVASEHLTCTGDTALHLVGHEQHVVFLADVVAFLQITFIRNVNASLTLDRLQQETCDLLAVLCENLLQCVRIVVRDTDETRCQRTVVCV